MRAGSDAIFLFVYNCGLCSCGCFAAADVLELGAGEGVALVDWAEVSRVGVVADVVAGGGVVEGEEAHTFALEPWDLSGCVQGLVRLWGFHR